MNDIGFPNLKLVVQSRTKLNFHVHYSKQIFYFMDCLKVGICTDRNVLYIFSTFIHGCKHRIKILAQETPIHICTPTLFLPVN